MKPIASDQYPLPATRPRPPITNKGKIKRVFGVEMPGWEDQPQAFLSSLATMGHPRGSTAWAPISSNASSFTGGKSPCAPG